MLKDIIVPELGMTTEEVTISTWLKQPGEAVARGEALVEIVTDKSTVELEATDDGTLSELLAPEGETVAVGTVIARLALGAAEAARAPAGSVAAPVAPPPSAPGPPPASPAVPANGAGAADNGRADLVRATPVARRLARRHGIDLAQVQGSGPQGRIRRADVESALPGAAGAEAPSHKAEHRQSTVSAPPPSSAPSQPPVAAPAPTGGGAPPAATVRPSRRGGQRVALGPAQRRLAALMTTSASIPQFSVARAIDVTPVFAVPRGGPDAPTFTDAVVKAVALTLRRHDRVNATLEGDELMIWDNVNVGVAVAVEHDLFVPVLADADRRPIAELARDRRELTARARAGSLGPADMANATFTISNMGPLGVNDVAAVVTPPQVAVLGVAAPVPTAVPDGDSVSFPQLATFRLTCDHRALNGATAAEFLETLAGRFVSPFSIGEA